MKEDKITALYERLYRSGFFALMKEVEEGNVRIICVKDMLCIGRDYLIVDGLPEALVSEEVWEQTQIKVAAQTKI